MIITYYKQQFYHVLYAKNPSEKREKKKEVNKKAKPWDLINNYQQGGLAKLINKE